MCETPNHNFLLKRITWDDLLHQPEQLHYLVICIHPDDAFSTRKYTFQIPSGTYLDNNDQY